MATGKEHESQKLNTANESAPANQRRRQFIIGAIYSLPCLIGGTLAAPIGTYLFGNKGTQTESWTDAGDISGLQKDTPVQISFHQNVVDGWNVQNEKADAWVVLDNKEQITAFSPLCTHLGCAYQWQTDKKTFLCPCHGSAFNMRGDVIAGPAPRALDKFAVKVEGRRLWLGPIQDPRSKA